MYKIRHALASWMDEKDVAHTAFRGQVVDVTPDTEAKRLLGYNAIIGAGDELVRPGVIQDLSASPSDEELLAWITAANHVEITDLLSTRQELRPRIEAALVNVNVARAYEQQHLEDVRRIVEGVAPVKPDEDSDAPTGGFTDDIGGTSSAGPTGADYTDTSHEGADDIILDPPARVNADGNPDNVETNTPLEQPTGGPGDVDYAALVQGPADGVAGYISTHPDEAENVLAAETKNTDNAPRAAIVLAARSATSFRSES